MLQFKEIKNEKNIWTSYLATSEHKILPYEFHL